LVLDIDGVLADFTLGFTSHAHELFGTEVVQGKDQPIWGHSNVMSDEQDRVVWGFIRRNPWWWGTLPHCLSDEDFESLSSLLSGAVMYLTNRPASSRAATVDWLWQNGLPFGSVVFAESKIAELKKISDVRRDGPSR
jgi:hypothetical protein